MAVEANVITMPNGAITRLSQEMYEQLIKLENELTEFAERIGHLVNVYAEAKRVTKGKLFLRYHMPMWNMLRGEHDGVVTDLASWAKKFHSDSGILWTVTKQGELAALALSWPGSAVGAEATFSAEDAIRSHVAEQNRGWRTRAFRRLFHCTTSDVPTETDVRCLCDNLYEQFEPLRKDRNENRAHKYEHEPLRAAPLSAQGLVTNLEKCQGLVADLRCLSSNSAFASYGYMVEAKENDGQAQDVVDLMLLGSLTNVIDGGPNKEAGAYWLQRRAAHYERLHVAHEAAGDPSEPFNNRALVVDFNGRLRG